MSSSAVAAVAAAAAAAPVTLRRRPLSGLLLLERGTGLVALLLLTAGLTGAADLHAAQTAVLTTSALRKISVYRCLVSKEV
jgi:Tfp pilus assembly protein PilV